MSGKVCDTRLCRLCGACLRGTVVRAVADVIMRHGIVDAGPVEARLVGPLEVGHVVDAVPQRKVQARLERRDVAAVQRDANAACHERPHSVSSRVECARAMQASV